MNKQRIAFLFTTFLTLALAATASAEVRVPSLIGDNMVLQQGKKGRIWGWANPKERVAVEVAGNKMSVVTDYGGHWQTMIGPLKSGGPFTLNITGSNALTFKNVLVGEVWVCSGQSNMEWPLVNTNNGADTVAQANFPDIRLFTVQKSTSSSPLEDVKGHWVVTTPDQAGQFSAVGYFFGRELHQKLKVPVGLIHTSWGGTPAEAWTSRDALAAVAVLKPILERYDKQLLDLPRLQSEYERAQAEWASKYVTPDPGNKGEAQGYAKPEHDMGGWKRMNLPQLWETAGLDVDGVIWFRSEEYTSE